MHFVHFDVGSVGFSGSEPISPFRFTFGVRAEEGFGLEDCGLSKRPQGLLGHFLGFLLPHLAVHEAGDEGGHHKDS